MTNKQALEICYRYYRSMGSLDYVDAFIDKQFIVHVIRLINKDEHEVAQKNN